MYLHLGDDSLVAVSSILAILDIEIYREASGNSLWKKDIAKSAEIRKEPRSVIVTDEGLYFSVISAQSLKKRIQSPAYGVNLHDFAVQA